MNVLAKFEVRSFIGRIHGAIVAATVGAIVAATIACSVYTRRLSHPVWVHPVNVYLPKLKSVAVALHVRKYISDWIQLSVVPGTHAQHLCTTILNCEVLCSIRR